MRLCKRLSQEYRLSKKNIKIKNLMWLIFYPMVMSKMWPNRKAGVYGPKSVYIFVNFKGIVIFLWNMMGHKFSSVENAISI